MNRYRKLIAALVGAALIAVSEGVLPGESQSYINVAIAFLTILGVYAVPNDPA